MVLVEKSKLVRVLCLCDVLSSNFSCSVLQHSVVRIERNVMSAGREGCGVCSTVSSVKWCGMCRGKVWYSMVCTEYGAGSKRNVG